MAEVGVEDEIMRCDCAFGGRSEQVKVFWSWQSDTPGKIGRHFVRDALAAAVAELQTDVELDEPDRDALHLDHDRKGVPGSPDLANVILEKIRNSTVFVADVTPVGKTEAGKPLINANVAIELGYALANVGDAGLLMVLNSAYGTRDGLPFDLRQKAGPIMFMLAPDASSDERKREAARLVGTLRVAIRDCLAAQAQPAEDDAVHKETPSRASAGEYFVDGEVLTERPSPTREQGLSFPPDRPLVYLRLIPATAKSGLRGSEIKDIVFGIKLQPLRSLQGGASWDRNKYGGITYSLSGEGDALELLTSSQVFFNREIWGIDATLLAGEKTIPAAYLEGMFETALRHYVEVAQERLGLEPPVIVEAGAVKVEGFQIVLGTRWNEMIGPIYETEIRSRHTLRSFDTAALETTLMAIYEDFFDAAGEKRPKGFRDFGGTKQS